MIVLFSTEMNVNADQQAEDPIYNDEWNQYETSARSNATRTITYDSTYKAWCVLLNTEWDTNLNHRVWTANNRTCKPHKRYY